MAAPQAKTIKDLNGIRPIDSSGSVLQAQGIRYLTRKGVALAAIHRIIKQYEAAPTAPSSNTSKATCIESTPTASSPKSTKETRYLMTNSAITDWPSGSMKGHTQRVYLDEIKDATLNLVLSYTDGQKAQARCVYDYQLE
ncbi:hypothetical protein B0T10DRAFT_534339 [Thelonectria olida]|uniref:Uncharacterized protein n=1 Tax=Thelonectria olida TaxID=1576542 RepID=A0A9P8VP15_9HYPO|nr:hypothetical protein B0T10DRAFT_534339 [Thelonectria olida]